MDLSFARAIDAVLILLALGASGYYFLQGQTSSAVLFLGAAVLFTVYDLIRRYLNDLTERDRGPQDLDK